MRSAHLALISDRQMHRINAYIFRVAITKKRPYRSFLSVPSELHTKILYLSNQQSIFPFSKPLRISPRPISTCQLNVLPRLHSKPINLVVFKGSYSEDGISYLEGGFTLRCLQRLSLPDLATLPCCWYNNRYTSGPSIPVLSY